MANEQGFWLPTIPYSIIDAINRMAAATGSMRYAQLAADANYNGHFVRVYFNDYRGYWLTEYQWGERCVLSRSADLARCLEAGKAEYARGARGTTVVCYVKTEADADLCRAAGFVPYSDETEKAHYATWQDARFALLHEARDYERYGMAPAVGFLANSKTADEYKAKLEAHLSAVKAARAQNRAGA
jgi:hypothetical protein